MRLPRHRFTVRRLMVAVAIVAVLSGVSRMWSLRIYYIERAKHFRRLADPSLGFVCSGWSDAQICAEVEKRLVLCQARKNSPERLRQLILADKYSRAARYPWLPVAPDPPEPEE